MANLFSDDVENGLLDEEKEVFSSLHVVQLDVGNAQLLHFENLVVAGPIVERIRPFREIVHDILLVEYWYPSRVVPRNGQ